MPGVFVQTMAFGAINTGIGLSEDLHKGLIERFRSLPMARSAVLAGRALSDLVRNVGVALIVVGLGFAVGFRAFAGILPFVGAATLLLLFSFAFAWIFALIGLQVPTAESAQAVMFPILAVLVFASTAFAPAETCRAGCRRTTTCSQYPWWSRPCAPSVSAARRRRRSSTPSSGWWRWSPCSRHSPSVGIAESLEPGKAPARRPKLSLATRRRTEE
jgi:ABC-type multidrug transport system permease subunit